jgi:hypothetical protein
VQAAGTTVWVPRSRVWICGSSSRRPLDRFPEIEILDTPTYLESTFANQMKTLPVRLSPATV